MASKNNNNNTNADSTGGFKTVAFGFDKNDVTLYIASLRKKMKQMEEEFQEKLKEALDNPAASNEALKHEREVIRAEMEKMWGEKLNERNQILKQQQNQITELEESVHAKDKIIDAMKAELSAAKSESGNDGSEMNARAAKAYVQFTTTLRSLTGSLQNTLETVEKTWKGEFEDTINELGAAIPQPVIAAPAEAASAPTAAPKSAKTAKAVKEVREAVMDNTEKEAKKPQTPVPAPEPAPAKAPFEPYDFGDEEEDPLKGIISDISDDVLIKEPEPVKAAGPEPSEPKPEEIHDLPDPVSEEKPVQNAAADSLEDFGDLGDLLAEPEPAPAPKPAPAPAPAPVKRDPAPAPKIDMDDDLNSLLAEPMDNNFKPNHEPAAATDDFAELLAGGKSDIDEDFLITEDDPAALKGEDLDVSLLSDMVILPGEANNGDLNKMLKEQEANEYAQFGDLFVTPTDPDDPEGDHDIKVDETDKAERFSGAKKPEKKEDDLFDFSFLTSDDDEDDMSTDASFQGML